MESGYQSHSGDTSRAGYHGDSTWTQRRARSKTDWAGVPIGCAFNASLDYYLRLEAQRRFYLLCRKIQRAAAKSIGADRSKPKNKPQIGPCYTTYPSTLAAQAAIGLTGFLEFRSLAPAQVLINRLAEYLKEPATADRVSTDPNIYRAVAVQVAKAVQTRLLLHALACTSGMAAIETYRLFSACQQNLRFRTVGEIVETVVVYGDVLPEWTALELHPVTRQLFEQIESASRGHFELLSEAKPHELMNLGEMWVRDLMSTLAPHLPEKENEPMPTDVSVSEAGPWRDEGCFRLGQPEATAEPPNSFGPLDGPAPPSLAGAAGPGQPPGSDLARRMAALLASEPQKAPPDPAGASVGKKILDDFSRALQEACGQTKRTEDMRSDLVEEAMRLASFEASPLQGNPVDGHEVTIRLGEDRTVGAQIHDRPIELSDDVEACDRLLEDSGPITRELKRVLYPNLEPAPETTRLCTGGSLDGGRLPLAEFSSTLFKRTRVQKRPDRRGRPVLLLVCDGSGSLNQHQMRMTKLLAAGWLVSTARTGIQVLAALYNRGPVSRGIAGALIHWIHHPEKTAALNRREAIRAVAALGDKGSGGQADAPSLQFLLDEARRLSRGRSIYLVLMSDTKWVRSVGGENGYAEVRAVLEDHIGRLKDRLHVTLVALGVNGKTNFEDVVDAVVRVSNEEITDAAAVAKKIALYVAACMRERRKLLDTPH